MTLDCHPLIVRTVASLKPNTAEARCMTTREGSRASVRREGRRIIRKGGIKRVADRRSFPPRLSPRPSVPAGRRRDVLQRHSFSGSPLYNVSHFTPVVTKASYNIDALDDAWYNAPPAGGTRR